MLQMCTSKTLIWIHKKQYFHITTKFSQFWNSCWNNTKRASQFGAGYTKYHAHIFILDLFLTKNFILDLFTSWNDFQAATDLSMTLGKLDSHKMMSNWYDQNSWCLAGATGEIKRVHADACGHSCTSSFANKSSQTAAAVAQISAHVTSEAWMWKFYKSIDDKLEFE